MRRRLCCSHVERERREYISAIPEAATGANNLNSGRRGLIPVRTDDHRDCCELVSWYLQRGAEDCDLMGSTVLRSLLLQRGHWRLFPASPWYEDEDTGTRCPSEVIVLLFCLIFSLFSPKTCPRRGRHGLIEQQWAALHLPSPWAGRPSPCTTPAPNLTLGVPC